MGKDKQQRTDNTVMIQCEVYSRVTGFYRPVHTFNPGKKEEFAERTFYNVNMCPQSR